MANETVTSPSGKTLRRHATTTTTPKESSEAKIIRITQERATRLAENEALLADPNVAAFLKAIAEAEGGDMTSNMERSRGREMILGALQIFPRTRDRVLAGEPLRRACIRLQSTPGASMAQRWDCRTSLPRLKI
jgi:hypothetical protein